MCIVTIVLVLCLTLLLVIKYPLNPSIFSDIHYIQELLASKETEFF